MAIPAVPHRRDTGWGLPRLAPVLLPLVIFNIAGIGGVDFGVHWDEQEQLENVRHSLATRTLLPAGGYTLNHDPLLAVGYYAYPSMLYWITMGSIAPEVLRHPSQVTRPELLDFALSNAFRLRVRAVCIVISSLAIVWVYLAAMRLSGSWIAGLAAAAILAGSWEISYQSRWIATDTIVMQFGALCLLLSLLTLDSVAWDKWARLAAVAAGLAAGTKYPAALLMLPVAIAALSRGAGGRVIAQLCIIAALTFIVTTPGALLQPWAFSHWLAYQHQHYGYETHWGYTVAGPLDHLWKIAVYETIVLFSSQPVIAAGLFILVAAGAVWVSARSPKSALVLLVFPVVYLVYFSLQRVMIVRNLLVVSPFWAVLCAVGILKGIGGLRWRGVRLATFAGVTAAVVFNLGFTLYAAWTIGQAGQTIDYDVVHLREYMREHPRTRFDLSPMTLGYLEQLEPPAELAAAIAAAPAHPDRELIVTCSEEDDQLLRWPANQWNLTAATFGPLDVNFNYYPTWERNRIVALDLDRAQEVMSAMRLNRPSKSSP